MHPVYQERPEANRHLAIAFSAVCLLLVVSGQVSKLIAQSSGLRFQFQENSLCLSQMLPP